MAIKLPELKQVVLLAVTFSKTAIFIRILAISYVKYLTTQVHTAALLGKVGATMTTPPQTLSLKKIHIFISRPNINMPTLFMKCLLGKQISNDLFWFKKVYLR